MIESWLCDAVSRKTSPHIITGDISRWQQQPQSHRCTEVQSASAAQTDETKESQSEREEKKAKSKVIVGSEVNIYVQIFVPK